MEVVDCSSIRGRSDKFESSSSSFFCFGVVVDGEGIMARGKGF